MNLKRYDNKCIRLVDGLGDIYEGVARHDSRDYNFHEYGKDEESIQMSHTIFFKSFIKKIDIIDSFSDKYGLLEESLIESGMDMVDEVLTSEDDISINRLLLCLEDKIKSLSKSDRDELMNILDTFIKYNDYDDNVKKAIKIRKMI
ncbi:MAG: hypothetical protein IIZ40_02145 [Bacilli bacterium]|nr:hypothetical protein [Bacilli bacterium]